MSKTVNNPMPYTRRIPGTPGIVTGGHSKTLGRNILAEMNVSKDISWGKSGYQAHHIIPVELKSHPILEKIGMDLDHASNGIFLRKPNNDVNIKSIHYTSHPKYTKAIERYLDSLDYNESVEVLESQVADLQKQLKRSLENGTPLHNSKGNITGPATYQNKGGGATNEMWDEEIQKTSYNPLKVYDSISEESIDATEESQDYIQKASELVDEMLREQNAQSEQEEYDYYNYYGY